MSIFLEVFTLGFTLELNNCIVVFVKPSQTMHTNPKGTEPNIVREFPILVIYYFLKGKTSSKGEHQMWIPKLNENFLQIDDRGEFYLDRVHYMDFRGISMPVVVTLSDKGLVHVTLAKNKHPGIFEIGIKSTLNELCRLRSPRVNR